MFLELIKTIILGAVEGITEWLPVSSTGHLIIFDSLLKPDVSDSFKEMFNVVIQLGAIIAVIIIYFRKLWPFHLKKTDRIVSKGGKLYKVQTRRTTGIGRYVYKDKIILWLKIFVSIIPAVIVGLPLDDWLNIHLYNTFTVALMLIIYGIIFIIVEIKNKNKIPRVNSTSEITFKDALIIGAFQCLALIPGTSRSGATIIGGIIIGLSRTAAAEYTFFLAIPTMLGASLLKLFKFGFHFAPNEIVILIVGMATAFVVSVFAIKFLMKYIKNHDFKAFGYYRIIIGIIVLVLGAVGVISAT